MYWLLGLPVFVLVLHRVVACESDVDFTTPNTLSQPKKIEEIKDFLITARRKDAKCKLWTSMYVQT